MVLSFFNLKNMTTKKREITTEMIYDVLLDFKQDFRDFKSETNKRFEQQERRFERIDQKFEKQNKLMQEIYDSRNEVSIKFGRAYEYLLINAMITVIVSFFVSFWVSK